LQPELADLGCHVGIRRDKGSQLLNIICVTLLASSLVIPKAAKPKIEDKIKEGIKKKTNQPTSPPK
jgi:hypothetical protein